MKKSVSVFRLLKVSSEIDFCLPFVSFGANYHLSLMNLSKLLNFRKLRFRLGGR